MRAWADLTAAQVKQVLDDEGIKAGGVYRDKASLVAYASSVLGPDPDNPVLGYPVLDDGIVAQAAAAFDAVDDRTIHQRLADILADLPAIGKDEQAPGNMGGYRYRGIEQITAALKPLLAKHGVVILPRVIERRDAERPTRQGGVMHVVDLLIEFTFVGIDGGDTLVVSMWGEGTDSGDKSPQKATTSAFKSMLAIVFCIADSETDAERHDVPEHAHQEEAPPPDGFATIEDADETILPLREKVKAVGLVEWVQDQAFPWPWPKAVCDVIRARVEAATGATAAAEPAVDPDRVPCAECAGTGLTTSAEDGQEGICPACAGDRMVCVECAQRLGDHAEGCSRGPF